MNILGLIVKDFGAGLHFIYDEAKKLVLFAEHAAPILLADAVKVFGHDAVISAITKAKEWADLNEAALVGKVEGAAVAIVQADAVKLHLMDSGLGAAAANHLAALVAHAIEIGGADVLKLIDTTATKATTTANG